MFHHPSHTVAVTALTPVAWGSTYLVTTELLPADRPLLAGLLRALPAGLILTAVSRSRPVGVWWWRTAVLGGAYIGVFFPLLFLAAYRLPGGVAATLGSVGPLLTLGLAALVLGEPATIRKAAAGVAGIVGVALVALRPGAGLDGVGLLAGFGGALSMTTGTVLARRWGRPPGVGALAFTGWQLTAGGLVIAPLVLLVEGLPASLDGGNVAGFAYLGSVNTALAYWIWFRGLERLPANSIAFLTLLSPLTAATLGWLVLGQSLDRMQLGGMALALGGSLAGSVVVRARRREPGTSADRTGAEVPPAEQLVGDDLAEQRFPAGSGGVAHHDRLPLPDEHAVDEAGVVRRPTPAPATILDVELDPLVGDLEQPPGAVEELAAEVGEEPEGVDVDVELVGDERELIDLLDGVELDLVAHQVVE